MKCGPICCFLFFLLCILIKEVGVEMKIFKAYTSACILGRAMKLLIQALQRYIFLHKYPKAPAFPWNLP